MIKWIYCICGTPLECFKIIKYMHYNSDFCSDNRYKFILQHAIVNDLVNIKVELQ